MSQWGTDYYRQDLREFSSRELALLVYNDEYLYLRRHRSDFFSMLESMFIFTHDQLAELTADLLEENEENC